MANSCRCIQNGKCMFSREEMKALIDKGTLIFITKLTVQAFDLFPFGLFWGYWNAFARVKRKIHRYARRLRAEHIVIGDCSSNTDTLVKEFVRQEVTFYRNTQSYA